MAKSDKVEIYELPIIETVRETEKAVLVRVEIESGTFWFPKSKVNYAGTKKEPILEVPDWLCRQRGIIDEEGYE